jgi:hypothetical protein
VERAVRRVWTPRHKESPVKKDPQKWCKFGKHIWVPYLAGVKMCSQCGAEKKDGQL